VGPGGLLIDPDGPIEAPVTAIRRLWDDKPSCQLGSGLCHATRPELNFDVGRAWEDSPEAATNSY
jgi:hypothetical protein